MAEIIFQKRKAATVFSDPNPLVILLLLSICQYCASQVINRAPHFIPAVGDMSQFSILENTPVGTPVYQLKGIDPENGQLTYSISGQYFTVDPQTGVVTLAKPLDREKQATLEIIISITDEPVAETEPNTISLRRVIAVKDINDNAPIFINRPYIVNISEATPVGSDIEVYPTIIVTDKDEGVNAEIQVKCTTNEKGSDVEACSTFKVMTDKISPGIFQVRLVLKRALDFESRTAYIVSLEAKDISDNPLRAVASVAVTVSDVQDQPPVFVNGPYSATVPENTPEGTVIMDILARDGDTVNPRPVLLTLEGDTEDYFALESDENGKPMLITTDIPIDRESDTVMQNGGVYTFFIKATELINHEIPSDFTVSQVTIIVTDEDDHIPEFNKEVFDVSIPENIENGSPIPSLSIYVQDDDIGQNSKYDLRLKDVFNSEGVFDISTDHGEGRTPISIKVKDSSRLDYDVDDEEMRLFSFDIIASVNGEDLSSARVNIKLLDVNDNAPVFDMSSYKFSVHENATIGSKVGDITAMDKDYGIFGEIEYSLNGFGSNLFRTDKSKGGIYVGHTLDYENQKSFSLTLFAKDGGGKVSSTSVLVDVLDVNDNAPVFELAEYTRTIREGAMTFEPQLIIRAADIDGIDQGDGRIKYSIESDNSIANHGNVFSIDEDTGELKVVNKAESMDTPRGQYELVVRATDYGHPPLHNETRVYIRVGVPGNQRPTFKGNFHNYKYTTHQRVPDSTEDFTFELNPMNYKASIREDAGPGENVTLVIANDPDGLDDLLTYHIVSGSKDNFIINEKTGLVTVSNDANLDRDINSDKYEIIVSAVDSGVPIPETATTTIFVTIVDVNNKPPKFNVSESTTYISEKSKIGNTVTKLQAYDTDINSKLKYSIIEPIKALSKAGVQLQSNSNYDYKSLFRIDEDTGEIFVNGTLDYSQASIVILTVKVVDINGEVDKENQFAVIEHTIYIQPYADKNPQFTNTGWSSANPIIYQKVREEQPIGSTVLVLTAEDPISGHVISNFKVINSETGLLQVDPLSGQVVLTKHLDYEELKNPNLTVTVKAASNDGSKHSIAKIIVEVVNINDNPPMFDKELYKVSVLESIKHPEQILVVKATDADAVLTDVDKEKGFSDIRYAIRGENSELFTIDNVTGIIQIAPNKTLDRERQSVMRLELIAMDTPNGGSDRLKSSSIIFIDVLDVDDNTPAFEKTVYTAVVPENVPIGISVTTVTAVDPDEGIGGEILYEFLDEGEANGFFTIDQTTGEIRTNRDLTGRGRIEPYRLLVGATDGGGHTGDTSLQLYIGDVSANDGVPRFIRPAAEEVLQISENATIGSPVFQAVASDPDDPTQPSGQLYYSIQQNNADSKIFAIDAQTGIITTRQPLDREYKSSYTLVLEVWDRGQPPQHSARVATVNVTDVDDHKPRFIRSIDDSPYIMNVKEEVPIDTVVGTLEAIDEDVGENAAIDYTIKAGNDMGLFKLERTDDKKGVIKVAATVDREMIARQVLTVKCFKYGSKPKLSKSYNRLDTSEIQVVIKINDVDDHLPEFESPNITIGVKLNVPIDTLIGKVKATDRDPEALPINYEIVNITFVSPIQKEYKNISQVVVLNNMTGELRIMKNLMQYADGIFRLVIRANNSDDPDRYGDVLVEVVVVRERDLLKLIWDTGATNVRSNLPALMGKFDKVLTPLGLKLQIHDAAPLAASDRTLDFTKTGACFQFRKLDSGEALTPKAMKATIRSLGTEFQEILESSGVRNVSSCGISRQRHSAVQHALLGLAAILPLAAFIAALVLCCMHSSAKRRARQALLIHREPPPIGVAPSNISAPTRLYAEPLYST
ncbi:hypothetical protein JYU34_016291 [Plutella xylostella]|uniref:Cadherin domain-containing protein n=1 Tax=Plutella xylostella TaxID=51655 RepID=A0ABQ7Q297_PLUXY|nr:hypothetical protein JYU34_016291 [Plutella xylostella]